MLISARGNEGGPARATGSLGGHHLNTNLPLYRLAVVAFALFLPLAVEAGEAIRMPFLCSTSGDGLELKPSFPHSYNIVGQRDARTYTACRDGNREDCRTMMVHRFKIRCGNLTIPWAEIAARVRAKTIGKSWMQDGQLNLLMANATAVSSRKKMARFVMPAGYAPVMELGGRFIKVGEAENESRADAAVDDGWEASVPAVTPAVLTGPSRNPGHDGGVDLAEGGEVSHEVSSWQTVVYRADGGSGAVGTLGAYGTSGGIGAGSSSLIMAFAVMASASLLVVLSWFGLRRFGFSGGATLGRIGRGEIATQLTALGRIADRVQVRTDFGAGLSSKLRALWVAFKWQQLHSGRNAQWSNESIANGAKSAEALYEKASNAVNALGPALALRDTLSSDLKRVRRRLDSLRGGNRDEARTARVAAGLRGAVRDLEQIGRIAECAQASFSKGREELAMPKTRAEAFEVLGANPGVSDAALKKIVDALRMGWHPDHSENPADQELREERTKQINIAWDLIVGKRAA